MFVGGTPLSNKAVADILIFVGEIISSTVTLFAQGIDLPALIFAPTGILLVSGTVSKLLPAVNEAFLVVQSQFNVANFASLIA